jgi:hypothetical protein
LEEEIPTNFFLTSDNCTLTMSRNKDLPSLLLPFRGTPFKAGDRTSGFGFNIRSATRGERLVLFFQMHSLVDLVEAVLKVLRAFDQFSGFSAERKIRMEGTISKGRELLSDYPETGKLREQQQLAFTRHECLASLIDVVGMYPGIVRYESVQVEVTKIKRTCPGALKAFLQDNNFC